MERLFGNNYFSTEGGSIAIEPRSPQPNYPEHDHDFDEIVIVNSGYGTHVLNGQPYALYPGMVCYIRAADHHMYENVDALCLTNVLYRSVDDFQYLRDVDRLLPHYIGHYAGEPNHSETNAHWHMSRKISLQIQNLLISLSDPTPQPASFRESLFLQLLVVLYQGCYSKQSADNNEDRAEQLLGWLRLNFTEAVDWPELADQFSLSLRTLHRHIKRRTGCTPQRFLNRLRLDEALQQLRYSEKSITEIAHDCGFNDSSYFATLFRSEFEITPRALRASPMQ